MRTERSRLSLFFIGTTILLLLIVLTLISDNNRRYAEALNRAMTSIIGTNQAVIGPAEMATSEAILTGLPLTLTHAAQTATPSPTT